MINLCHKNIKFAALAVLTAMLALVGCDKLIPKKDDPVSALLGTWELTTTMVYYGESIANPDSSVELPDVGDQTVLTFSDDSTGIEVSVAGGRSTTISFDYVATDNDLTLTFTGNVFLVESVIDYAITGEVMTFTKHVPESIDILEKWVVRRFIKI